MKPSIPAHQQAIVTRFEAIKGKLFSRDTIDLSIASKSHDPNSTQYASSIKLRSLEDLQKYLEDNEPHAPSDLVVMIAQEYSWGRLRITEAAFQLLTRSLLNPFPPFLELVGTFGFRTSAQERPFHGWRGCALTSGCQAETHEICYNIQYVEKHGRQIKDPWSLRQTGVYHQRCPREGKSRWVLLNPSTALRSEITEIGIHPGGRPLEADTMHLWALHAHILHKLGSNWTEYVEYLASELADQNDKACHSSIDSMKTQGLTLSYADLQDLHMLQAKFQSTASALTSCIDICKGCHKHVGIHAAAPDPNLRSILHLFDTYEADVVRHLSQVRKLEARLKCTLELLTKLLMFRNEELLHTSNQASCKTLNALLDLTTQGKQQQETLNSLLWRGYADSAMLKALSIVATVCLPASLVATIFSSNLVQPGDPERRGNDGAYLVLSHQFWVYIAISVPLMAAVLVWVLYLGYKSRQALNRRVKDAV
ncbi:hypothetical protein BJY01DRAFT_250335 [Aspergillus pseudoustus]|uniref:CorA-like transporter domain-containing protein n=1 Tax=Aspergillus pseudoustus TaxID=1810923 RepID=A0ABR4JIB1_9EURO